jgi:hypothetical protein
MRQLTPELLDLIAEIRQVALSYDDAEEYTPWGTLAFFRGLKGRNFLFVNDKLEGCLEVIVQLLPAQRDQIMSLPFVELHKSMGKGGWVSAKIRNHAEVVQVIPWIHWSYALNKPIRDKEDLLPGEAQAVLDFLTQVRQIALAYEDIEEYFPFGERAFRPRKGKIFLYTSEQDECLLLKVRLTPMERDYALTMPFVDVPRYIGHQGWVAGSVTTQEELDIMLPWIGESYNINQPVRKGRARK